MIKPKYILILELESDPQQKETWGSLTDICEAHPALPYPTLKKKKFPFSHSGYRFLKIEHKTITMFENPMV